MRLYNTMSLNQEVFKPHSKKEVKIFTCGPSIYRSPHIGNYRTFIYEDLLIKYLHYLGYKTKRVINFTDVEDKGISEATLQKRSLKQLTNEAAAHFFKDAKLLDIQIPSDIPRTANSVTEAVKLIQKLIKKGYAYWYKGDVFFEPLKKKDFGKLFHLDMSKWPTKKLRFKRDNYDNNRWNFGDFIIWHGYKKGESIYWDTPIGKGRPAWHIQDPAIITKILGYQIDVKCGGIDNIYRHHDYTIAIMEAISGKPFANYYLHGAHLFINGKKMSKRHGNITYPTDLIKKGYMPAHIRFFLGMTKHYRKKLYFTNVRFKKQSQFLDAFRNVVEQITKPLSSIKKPNDSINDLIKQITTDFEDNMNDDLNASAAIKKIYKTLLTLERKKAMLTHKQQREIKRALVQIDKVLNIIF